MCHRLHEIDRRIPGADDSPEPSHELIGVRTAHYPEEVEEECEDVVALFTSQQAAQDYLDRSRLASYREWGCGRGQHGRQFRASSLLRPYCSAYVQPHEAPDEPPVDPTL